MIIAYHRPTNLDEALKLLARPNARPLGGGTLLSKHRGDPIEAVDLQAVGLNGLHRDGNELEIGATVKLEQVQSYSESPADLRAALRLEAPLTLRNSATVAGTLATCDGRSTFTCALLALDAGIELIESDSKRNRQMFSLGEFLLLRPLGLITKLLVPIQKFAFEFVARTPADKPLVCAALSHWNSGRTRLVIGGFGKLPLLAMDGTEPEGIAAAARNACKDSGDAWASADFRADAAATLARRCFQKMQGAPAS